MRKFFSLIFVSTLCIAGCSSNTAPNRTTFRMNISEEPSTLDPRKAYALNAIAACRMLFEGLMRISEQGQPEPAVAERVDISADGREYVFHLREAKWSNGEPVTSFDFAECWKQILDPNFPTNNAYQLYLIQNAKPIKLGEKAVAELGVETPDPHTLIVRLEEPTPYFLEVCATTFFFPVPRAISASDENWTLEPNTFVGNGPFVLKAWAHTDELCVAKNPTYWDQEHVHLKEVRLTMVSTDTEMRMFEEGELDLAGALVSSLPLDAIEDLKKTGRLKMKPVSGTRFLRLNTSETASGKRNLFSSIDCRKALSYALDRASIVEHLMHGTKIAATGFVPPEMNLLPNKDGYFADINKEMARKLFAKGLASMNLSKEEVEPIVINSIDLEFNRALVQAMQQQLQEALDIKVVLQTLESKTLQQRVKEKDFQIVLSSWIADFNDPINYLEVFKFKETGSNRTGWENPKYIELLDRSAICRDQAERARILQQAEGILMDEMPIIPLYHEATNYLQQPDVHGLAISPIGGFDVRWVKKG